MRNMSTITMKMVASLKKSCTYVHQVGDAAVSLFAKSVHIFIVLRQAAQLSIIFMVLLNKTYPTDIKIIVNLKKTYKT